MGTSRSTRRGIFDIVRVGVVDLGGNTARLLVAELGPNGLERVLAERVVLGLGAEIERTGRISKAKLAATGATVRRLCGHADGVVAVCDVGGGSTEIAIGLPAASPAWCCSLDLGSLRITRRYFRHLSPRDREIEAARSAVRDALGALGPPRPAAIHALASGGTARALRKLVGARLGRDELHDALEILRRTEPRKLARRFDVPPWRAEVLAGGTVVLAEIQGLLSVPLMVADGGLREGAVLRLLQHETAAAA